jgi:hypothetical protein
VSGNIRPCPVCSGSAREPLFEQRFAMIEGVSILDGYMVVVCTECGATFADAVPSQAEFDAYYRESSKYTYSQRDGAESPADALRLAHSAQAIAEHAAKASDAVMDVGAASGRLLAELRALGFSRLRGIDPSPECAATAGRLHQADVEALTLRELAGRGQTFDCVVLIGVLEHLVDVRQALDWIREITHEGSRLYIEVPDVTRFADLPNAPFQEFSVEHVNYFSLATLTRALGAAGFRVSWHEQGSPVQAGTTRVSNLAVVAVRESHALSNDRAHDADSRTALLRYTAVSRENEKPILERIEALVRSQERFILWGAGTFALRLLATSALRKACIEAVADSNSRYQGHRIEGIPVISPQDSTLRRLPYVVASRAFFGEITDQIRSISGPETTVVGLSVIT